MVTIIMVTTRVTTTLISGSSTNWIDIPTE